MSMSSIPSSSQSGKLYGWVERIGNKVPHPFLLFIYLIIVLMVTTAILSAFGVSAKNPTDGTPVVVKNLLSVEGLHWFLPNVIKNFSGFAPLGAILALVLGAGLAERVGLLPALMVKIHLENFGHLLGHGHDSCRRRCLWGRQSLFGDDAGAGSGGDQQ